MNPYPLAIARSAATKQSSPFDKLRAQSQPRGWIAAAGCADLAMTTRGVHWQRSEESTFCVGLILWIHLPRLRDQDDKGFRDTR